MIDPNTLMFIITVLIYSIILGLNKYMNYKGWRYWIGSFFVSMGLASIILGLNDVSIVIGGIVWVVIGAGLWLIKGNRDKDDKKQSKMPKKNVLSKKTKP